MHWANIKDFPDFYHLDTILHSSPKTNESSDELYPSLYLLQRNNTSNNNSFIKKPRNSKHHSSRSEDMKLPLLNIKSAENILKNIDSSFKSQNLRQKIQNQLSARILYQPNELSEKNMIQKTKEFLNHLNSLSYSVPLLPRNKKHNVKKVSFSVVRSTKPTIKSNLNIMSPTFSISEGKSNIIQIPKPARTRNTSKEKNKKKMIFNKRMYEKKLSLINRLLIPNYSDLKEQIKKFTVNLNELKEIIFNSKKIFGFIKHSLGYKNSILTKILLNEENECLYEPIFECSLEDKCFTKETYYEGCSIKNREKLDPNVTNDLKELNEKIENFNISHAIEKIKLMEHQVIDEFHKMKGIEMKLKGHKNRNNIFKDYKPIEKFNYKNMPASRLVDEINNFEKNHGECEYILNRSRLICEAIETSVKNVRSECEN